MGDAFRCSGPEAVFQSARVGADVPVQAQPVGVQGGWVGVGEDSPQSRFPHPGQVLPVLCSAASGPPWHSHRGCFCCCSGRFSSYQQGADHLFQFSTPDHVTMLIKPSTTFDQKRFKCFFTHSVDCSCGQKCASSECCGLCGSLLILLGFHGVAMVNGHCQRSASVKMRILVFVEAVPRFQADTWILPHFQLKEQENLVLVDLQKHYQLGKGIKWMKISCSLRRICCQNELDL